ncbi:MAG: DUF2079 domain-containing protein [Actinomycetota bacterium]|nr:DUF2079 domain-containing protein [Actinomycetota bacterium]
MRRHEAFRSGYDLANFDQVLWLLANLHEPLDTQTGRVFWGEHFSPTISLLAPLYALGAGPVALLVIQALTMALVAPLLYALARAYDASPWLAALPALLWLLSPLTLIPNVNDLHHVPLVAPLIVGSILALKRDRLVVFAMLALLASFAKEDISLVYLMLGLVVALEGRRRLGAAIAAAALGVFLFAVVIFLPTFSDSSAWFAKRFAGDRGESLSDVVVWMASHPVAALGDLFALQNLAVFAALVLTTGGLCLLAPRWMLLGLPVLAHNFLSAYGPQHGVQDHYQVPIALAFAVAAAVGVHRLALAGARVRILATAAVTLAVVLFPVGVSYVDRKSEWSSDRTALTGGVEARREMIVLIPDDVPLAASTRLTPHLAHRRELYTLPLPFFGGEELGVDWSQAEMNRRAAGVRWVIVDTNDVPLENPRTRELIVPILEDLGFRTIARRGTVSVHVR